MPDARAPRTRTFPGEKGPTAPRERPKAPLLELEVVEWLERLFPEPTGAPGVEGVMYSLGARSVARFVRAEYQRQIEET